MPEGWDGAVLGDQQSIRRRLLHSVPRPLAPNRFEVPGTQTDSILSGDAVIGQLFHQSQGSMSDMGDLDLSEQARH